MIGLGEKREEISAVMKDLFIVGCSILTVGQYLSPSPAHTKVKEYIHPDIFKEIESEAKEIGFKYVASAPFVRSSFNAALAYQLYERRRHE